MLRNNASYHHHLTMSFHSLPAHPRGCTPSSPTHTPSSQPGVRPMAPPLRTAAPSPRVEGVSVFEVLNIFRRQWFLNRDHLISKVLSAQKDNLGNVTWVDFDPIFHTSLVRRALSLLPPLCPAAKGKRVMFVFLLEVLTGREGAGLSESRPHFFTPQKKRQVRNRPSKAAETPALCPTLGPPPAKAQTRPPPVPPPSASVRSRSLSTVPEDVTWREGSDNSRFEPVTLSQVENLVATHEMIQALHARTPPPALSPSSSTMELDAGPIPPLPPLSPASLVGSDVPQESFFSEVFRTYPWMLTNHPPVEGDWSGYLTAALEADILPAVLAKCIDYAVSPKTRKDKANVKLRKAALRAITHDLGTLFSPPPTPPPLN